MGALAFDGSVQFTKMPRWCLPLEVLYTEGMASQTFASRGERQRIRREVRGFPEGVAVLLSPLRWSHFLHLK